jgi:ABC-type multidrug transport system fused ATPase/permease subunit
MQLNRSRREINARSRLDALKLKSQLKGGQLAGMYLADLIPAKLSGVMFHYGEPSIGIRPAPKPNSAQVADTLLTKQPGFFKRSASQFADHMHKLIQHDTYQPEAHRTESEPRQEPKVFGAWDLTVPQGSLIALIGRHGDGKSTLLKLIGGMLLPTSGELFIPPHLRVYFITQESYWFKTTLYENLVFGINEENVSDKDMSRVIAVCERVGVPERVLTMIQGNETADWKIVLSMSESAQLNIVRGLLANPEVLVIEKPTISFTDHHAKAMYEALRAHVEDRGLDIAEGEPCTRRPRTCIFTATREAGVHASDEVYLVTRNCVRAVTVEEAHHEFLS